MKTIDVTVDRILAELAGSKSKRACERRARGYITDLERWADGESNRRKRKYVEQLERLRAGVGHV